MRKTKPYKPSPYAGYELYVRDASGNILATYSSSIPNYTSEAQIKDVRVAMEETYIYGSSRIGVDTNSRNTINRGAIQYELTNHLGNVLAVVTGKKLRDADYNYLPDLVSTQDYSPFGMQIEGRSWNSKEYRFGFQGQETENDMYGDGNAYDFGARMYDSRLGRFWGVDPLAHKFASQSPYSSFGNNSIRNVDVGGMFQFDAQTLAILKQYPIAFDYLTKTDYLKLGNITELARSELILNAMIANTYYANPNSEEGDFRDPNLMLTPEIIQNAFLFGNGPEIKFSDEPGGVKDAGGYNEKKDAIPHGTLYDSPIVLNKGLLIALNEAATDAERKIALTNLSSTILHENMEDFSEDEIKIYNSATGDYVVKGIWEMQREIYGGYIPGYKYASDFQGKKAHFIIS